MKERVCTSCKQVGKPKKQCFESFFVDLFIWGVVGSFALMTGLMPALIIPVAWTLFHLLKFGTTKCPSCGNLDMVSKTSSKGRAALNSDADNGVNIWINPEVAQQSK